MSKKTILWISLLMLPFVLAGIVMAIDSQSNKWIYALKSEIVKETRLPNFFGRTDDLNPSLPDELQVYRCLMPPKGFKGEWKSWNDSGYLRWTAEVGYGVVDGQFKRYSWRNEELNVDVEIRNGQIVSGFILANVFDTKFTARWSGSSEVRPTRVFAGAKVVYQDGKIIKVDMPGEKPLNGRYVLTTGEAYYLDQLGFRDFVDGAPGNRRYRYSDIGKLEVIEQFEGDRLIVKERYFESGNLSTQNHFNINGEVTLYVSRFEDGALKQVMKLVNGTLTSVYDCDSNIDRRTEFGIDIK